MKHVGSDNRFLGQVQLDTGTQRTFTVVASDPSGNARTNTYQVDVSGSAGGPFTYDDNGNLTSDGVKAYEWDAEDRLVVVKQGGNTLASFVYDGNGRRLVAKILGRADGVASTCGPANAPHAHSHRTVNKL